MCQRPTQITREVGPCILTSMQTCQHPPLTNPKTCNHKVKMVLIKWIYFLNYLDLKVVICDQAFASICSWRCRCWIVIRLLFSSSGVTTPSDKGKKTRGSQGGSKKQVFEAYMTTEDVSHGLKRGELIQVKLDILRLDLHIKKKRLVWIIVSNQITTLIKWLLVYQRSENSYLRLYRSKIIQHDGVTS